MYYTPKYKDLYVQPQGYYVDVVVTGGSTPTQGLTISRVTGDGAQLEPSASLNSSVTLMYTKSSASEADPAGTIKITGMNVNEQVVTKTITIADSCQMVSDTVLFCPNIAMPDYAYGGLYTYTAVYTDSSGKGKQEAVYDQYIYIKPMELVYDPLVEPAHLSIADYNADTCELVWRTGSDLIDMSADYIWQNPSDAAKAYYAGSAIQLSFSLKLGGSGSTAVFTEEEAKKLQDRLQPWLYIYDSRDNQKYAEGEVSVQAGTGIVVVTFLLDDNTMFPIGGDYKLSLEVVDPEDQYACFDNQDGKTYYFLGVKPSALVLTGANGTAFTADETGLNYTWKADFTALTGSTVDFSVKLLQGNQPRCLTDFVIDDYHKTPAQLHLSTAPQNDCSWVENQNVWQLRCTENWDTNTISYWQEKGESSYDYTLYNNVTPPTISEIKIIPENTASASGSEVTMSVSLEP